MNHFSVAQHSSFVKNQTVTAMVVEALLESLSRCFGTPGQPVGDSHHRNDIDDNDQNEDGAGTNSRRDENLSVEGRRNSKGRRSTGDSSNHHRRRSPGKSAGSSSPSPRKKSHHDMDNAGSSSQTRRPTQSPNHRHRTASLSQTKAKADKRRDDIFRLRGFNTSAAAQPSGSPPETASPSQNAAGSISRLLVMDVGKSLCFATPVRESSSEAADDEKEIKSVETSGGNTQNTAEDTITSTLYFDAKYSHIVESRPPMPLFRQFEVPITADKPNELTRIISAGSHTSRLSMIRIYQREQMQAQQQQRYQQARMHREEQRRYQEEQRRYQEEQRQPPPPAMSQHQEQRQQTAPTRYSPARDANMREVTADQAVRVVLDMADAEEDEGTDTSSSSAADRTRDRHRSGPAGRRRARSSAVSSSAAAAAAASAHSSGRTSQSRGTNVNSAALVASAIAAEAGRVRARRRGARDLEVIADMNAVNEAAGGNASCVGNSQESDGGNPPGMKLLSRSSQSTNASAQA